MVTGFPITHQETTLDINKLYQVYGEFETMIEETSWYQIFWRRRLKISLETLKYVAAMEGFKIAIADLERCGILKAIK